MPKQRITKQDVVEAAFHLARQGGMEQVLVKNIAARLNCSVQPIYSYCKNMDALRREVEAQADAFVRQYAASRIDPADPFRAAGQAYLQLAREEPHLFRIFILHHRENTTSLEQLVQSHSDPQLPGRIAQQLHIPLEAARQLHRNMLLYTVGLGAVFSVTDIPPEEIFACQEQAYAAFLAQARQKEDPHEP